MNNSPTEPQAQPNNPLHGITLKEIVEDLVQRRGFENLASIIKIRSFSFDPSVRSTLKFLRKTDWARHEVEALYLKDHEKMKREGAHAPEENEEGD